MSRSSRETARKDTAGRRRARVFSALGDETRLALVQALSAGAPLSIARLTHGSRLSRQAITKHLRVLQRAGVVRAVRHGRESRFELRPSVVSDARAALESIARQWEAAFERLRMMVENDQHGPR